MAMRLNEEDQEEIEWSEQGRLNSSQRIDKTRHSLGGAASVDDNAAGPSRLRSGNETQRVLEEVSDENWSKVRAMDDDEREEEKRELEDRFGGKVVEALRKRAAARALRHVSSSDEQEVVAGGVIIE